MDQLFTQVHFLFWQPCRVVDQYTTYVKNASEKQGHEWGKTYMIAQKENNNNNNNNDEGGFFVGWLVFYGISSVVGYLMPGPVYIYINWWFVNNLVKFGFMAYQPL